MFLFGEDVAMVRLLPLYFPRTCQPESLLGTGVCFHFGHCTEILGTAKIMQEGTLPNYDARYTYYNARYAKRD